MSELPSDGATPPPPPTPSRKGRGPFRSWRTWIGLARAFCLSFVALGAVAGIVYGRFTEPGPLATDRAIVIPRGAYAQVADLLAREGVVRRAVELRIAARLTRGDGALHAGELEFPAHASLRQVLVVLRTARPVQHMLTIPEGLTAVQIAALLDHAPALDGPTPRLDEGDVLPETYAYEFGTTRAALVARAAAAMTRTLHAVWRGRAPGLPLLNPGELLTLASIVERETALPEERPEVAAVFLNRLRRGMRLQSDPTVIYAVSDGAGTLDRKLTRADLDSPSPYNTYRIPALPPGPICAPGIAALEAVAHPAGTDALYFVADGTGGHAFARTLDDHNRNVARWRERGG